MVAASRQKSNSQSKVSKIHNQSAALNLPVENCNATSTTELPAVGSTGIVARTSNNVSHEPQPVTTRATTPKQPILSANG